MKQEFFAEGYREVGDRRRTQDPFGKGVGLGEGLRRASIDEVLGSASHRYFGDGYRAVQVRLSHLRDRDGSSGLVGRLAYPPAWSSKAGSVRADIHLGTIDAVVLACRAAEMLTEGPTELTSVRVSASSSPTVDVDSVPIVALQSSVAGQVFLVGALRVELGFVGERRARKSPIPTWMTEPATMSTAVVRVEEIELTGGSARAMTTRRSSGISPWCIDSRGDEVAVADVIAVAGALTEAALFSAAAVTRDTVGNFWMRRAQIDFSPGVRVARGEITVSTLRSYVFESEGTRWHSARVLVESELGFTIRADVAFEERGEAKISEDIPERCL